MSISVNELINAARSIAKGEGDYILITKKELMDTCNSFHETKKEIGSRLEPREPITEQPVASKPEETTSVATSYRPVKYGEADPNDNAGDIEMSNKPVYYVPVGDGLYRPTLDRRIFLFHACMALCKGKKVNTSFGEQYEYLIECGFERYDICLAVKMREADVGRMIGKDNEDVPYYIRTKWSMCFDTHRPWHPVTIKKNNASKAIEQKQEEEDQATLKKLSNNEEQEETTAELAEETTQKAKANTLVGSKYYIKTIISENEGPVNFNNYPNFLNVCVRKEGARGCGTSYPNLDAISNWLKEDTEASKDFPLKDLKSFTAWCADYQISARQFLAMFDRQYNAQLAFTNDLVNAINTRLGVELLAATAKRNPRPKKENTDSSKTPTEEVPEHIAKIKQVLWGERKYGITTLRRLFSILESVASRQQVIDLFHIQENELTYPTELNKNTAIEINKFCGKSVAIGNV